MTVGESIQAYVRARRDNKPEDAKEANLTPSIRERVDALGLDTKRLLSAAPEKVIAELERLEREAVLEDARVRPSAAQTRLQEDTGRSNGKPSWRKFRTRA